jgi:peptide/nickel transport system substrate-binding protein
MKKLIVLLVVLAVLAACGPTPAPQVIEKPVEVTRVVVETQVVEGAPVEVTKIVKEEVQVVVTATPVPVVKEKAPDVLGLPRNEMVIADILTGRVGTPSNFNNWVGWKWQDRGMQTLANEPLWSVDFATGKIVSELATGDPIYNDTFTELTIPLREGVAWDDGVPFTAADVVFTVETLIKFDGFNAHTAMVDDVESVSAPDDYTVVFKLKQSNSRFHTRFLDRWGCTWIMPKHIFEKVEDPVTFEFNPFVGTGPYKLHSVDPNGYWTIWEKRADWDKSPTGILYGEPKPKYIVYQYFANEGAKILAQLTHQADVLNTLSADGLKAVLAQSKTSRAYQPAFPWVVNNDPCITGIAFNTTKAPYDNRDVRWALLLAIDIVEHMGIAVDGTGTLSPVHIPSLGTYPENFIKPMQQWLSDFTLDLGNGETFKPYEPDAPKREADYAIARGYVFPDDPAYIEKAFGIGWYKYAPDVAEKLLLKNGFSKDKDGKWLLPDGTPWKIRCLTSADTVTHNYRNCMAATQQWKKFGIDAEVYPSESRADLYNTGDFEVSGDWPAQEPWGAGPDLYRVLNHWNSAYVKPIGEVAAGHPGRWSSPEMDAVIKKLRETDPADAEAVIAVGIEGLKIAVTEMPGIPTYGYIGFLSWDQYYWTNWPGSENPYTQPYTHWGPFKFMTPFLEPTGN